MKDTFRIQKIGTVQFEDEAFALQLEPEYIPGLINIDGFAFLQIIWWGHKQANKNAALIIDKPYTKGPEQIGVFASRSEHRPNPVLITNVQVLKIDKKTGTIYTPYIDAEPGSVIIDIKPYHGVERIKGYSVPEWCKHWPKWYEEAAVFDWQAEFNF